MAAGLSPARSKAIERFYGALASRDFDMVDGALTPDWEDIPLAPGQAHGPAGIKPVFAMLATAFPDLRLEIMDVVTEGDRIRRTWHMEDLFGLFAQIGAWPAPAPEAA